VVQRNKGLPLASSFSHLRRLNFSWKPSPTLLLQCIAISLVRECNLHPSRNRNVQRSFFRLT
jgi:hypothetical protein